MKSNKLYERALITCAIMLFICILFKLFGFNYFNLNTDIPILKEIDNVVMNSVPLSFLYSFIFKFINGYLVCCIVRKETKLNMMLLGLICVLSVLMAKYINNSVFIGVYDSLSLYLLCYTKHKPWEYLLVVELNIAYQIISLFIRSLGIQLSYHGLINSILLNLDYYIMLVITYLYLKRGDKTLCSIVRHSGSSLANLLWKKRSENYLNKKGK